MLRRACDVRMQFKHTSPMWLNWLLLLLIEYQYEIHPDQSVHMIVMCSLLCTLVHEFLWRFCFEVKTLKSISISLKSIKLHDYYIGAQALSLVLYFLSYWLTCTSFCDSFTLQHTSCKETSRPWGKRLIAPRLPYICVCMCMRLQ